MIVNEETLDIVKEMINIGCGSGAGILNQMVKSHITLHVPSIVINTERKLLDEFFKEYKDFQYVNVTISGDIKGEISMLLTENDLFEVLRRLTGEEILSNKMDSLKIEVTQEIGNIILNSISGTISNLYRLKTINSLPEFHHGMNDFMEKTINNKDYSYYVIVETSMKVDNLDILFYIIILFQAESFQYLVDNIGKVSLFNLSKGMLK